MRRIAVAGTGLIGTSLGLALAASGEPPFGWDPEPIVLGEAADRGAVVPMATYQALLDAEPELLVLAGPPRAVVAQVGDPGAAAYRGLVMDVAAVKGPIVGQNRFPRFVGTHPMAGRETSGPSAASGGLFRGAAWVVVANGAENEDVMVVERLIESVEGRPIRLSAEQHDSAVAAISHVPQLLASTLMNEATARTQALDLVAGSFRDLTRVAASESGLWLEVLDANRDEVVAVLREYIDRLDAMAGALSDRRLDDVSAVLDTARSARRTLSAPTAAVRVALADEPGELAKVGHAFETSGVDVRDLQLRHAPYGGGGVLTVSVRTDDEQAMRAAIRHEGLLLID